MKKKITLLVLFFLFWSIPVLQANEEKWKTLNLQARALFNQGETEKAIAVAVEALNIARTDLGETHPSYGKSLNNLGVLYFTQGDFNTAKEYYDKALKNVETYLGPNHLHVSDTLFNRARLYYAQKSYSEALQALERSLEIRDEEFQAHQDQAVAIAMMLAGLYRQMGLTDEAVALESKIRSGVGTANIR